MQPEQQYELGPNDSTNTVLSLKANAMLLRDVCEDQSAWIVFTSDSTARITCGEEEYELSIAESMPTVTSQLCIAMTRSLPSPDAVGCLRSRGLKFGVHGSD
jgi:hypothetical protein